MKTIREELKAKVEKYLFENEGGVSATWGEDSCTTFNKEGEAIEDYMIDVEEDGEIYYTAVSCPSSTLLVE